MTEPQLRPQVLAVFTDRERHDVAMARQLVKQSDFQFRLNKIALSEVWNGLRQRYGFDGEALYDEPSGSVYVMVPVEPEPEDANAEEFEAPLPPPSLRAAQPITKPDEAAAPNRRERRKRNRK